MSRRWIIPIGAACAALLVSCASSSRSSTTSTGTSVSSASVTGGGAGGGGAGGDGGLGVVDARTGTGARATRGQCLYVHYVGVLPDGRQFETSRDSTLMARTGRIAPPIVFELGTRAVMPGWEQGLPGMQVGGVRRLFVPYRLAYGANGRPPAIPPRTDLVFDIELLAVAASLPTLSNAMRAETAKSCPAWESVSRTR
jgi:peptidylprolyl isomerase